MVVHNGVLVPTLMYGSHSLLGLLETYIDLIGEVLQKDQVRSTRNRRDQMYEC